MKRILGIMLATMLLMTSAAFADSVVDVIMNTGTTQAFTEEAVSDEDLETILRAGLSTESAINQQPWFFVAVTNQEVMKEISGSGMSFGGAPAGGRPEGAPAGAPEGKPEFAVSQVETVMINRDGADFRGAGEDGAAE